MSNDQYDDGIDVTPTDSQSASGLDPLYQQIYGNPTTEVAERRTGFPVIPSFSHYVLKPLKASRHKTQAGAPGARAQVEVLEGPSETVGHKFVDSGDVAWGFVPSRKGKDGADVDDVTFKGKVASRQGLLNRVRQALGLTFAWPQNFSDQAVEAYCFQFTTAKPFVAAVQVEKGNDGIERNRIDWQSAAGLDEPEVDSNKRPTGKTAGQVARERIAQANAKLGAKQPGAQTAASLAPMQIG